MKTLVWVEHEGGAVKDATLSAVTAASKLGEVHLLVAGEGVSGVAEAAAKIAGEDREDSLRNCKMLSLSTMSDAMQPDMRGDSPASISPLRRRDSGDTVAQAVVRAARMNAVATRAAKEDERRMGALIAPIT